jgi:hypothetical protein
VDKSKIKNFIIIVLVLVNVFLLVIVVSNARERRHAELYNKQALENIFTERGIYLNPNIKLPDKISPQVSLKRDTDNEYKRISALLGNCVVDDLGGNIYSYKGPNGIAEFRGNGEFDILLYAGVISKGKDPVDAAKIVMKKLGIEYSDAEIVLEENGTNTSITLLCSWDGTPIYNSRINFYYNSKYLTLISGSRPLDIEYSVQSSEDYLDSATVLMSFLESVRQTGDVFSEINNLKIMYTLNSAVSGDCTLKPIWCLQTNSKYYYIDARTGRLENAELVP